MRLLPEHIQLEMWNTIVNGLNQRQSNFRLHLENVGCITGKMEAYYAVIAANFISGTINASLKYTTDWIHFDLLMYM